ncbi:MAG: HIT domain-containing protein [Candidatus Ratteibacteria bacterium]|jgi:histidine triad (HIT) family protein
MNTRLPKNKTAYQGCLFCRIVKGEIPAQKIFENKELLAFRDINPQAPIHIIIIPKKHIASLSGAEEKDNALLGRLQLAISEIAEKLVGKNGGYRIVTNRGEDAGQSVFHLHYHLLAGRIFTWPPG